jgi:hypothetical protein
MNYYASGGQTQGLKSLAQELPKYGRYGDDVVAHISSDEARMLKAMGGSGTINPATGLPEYFLKSVFKPVQDVWKGITNIPGIKQVSDAVTPVMQTLAPYAPYIAPFIPGVGPLMAAGIGAAGAGFGGKGRSGFDFKRGLMGGMTAYGLSNLYSGLQAAGGSLPGTTTATSVAPASSSAAEMAQVALAEGAPTAGMVATEPGIASQLMSGEIGSAATQFGQKAGTMGTDFATQMSNAGQGIKNLTGLGTQTVPLGELSTGSKAAFSALGKEFGTGSAAATFTGISGMAALDEQQKYLDQQLASGNIAQSEYDSQAARINEAKARAEQAVRDNPYKFAVGGTVSDEPGMDEARGLYQGNMSNGFMNGGSTPSYAQGGEIKGYAAGGMPGFGNGYNPFAKLTPMSGPLGGGGQPITAQNQPSFPQSPFGSADSSVNTTTDRDMMGGIRGVISGGLSSAFPQLGAGVPISSSIPSAMPQPLDGLSQQLPTGSVFNSSTGMSSNSGAQSSNYPSGYGGAGGNSGAFPLQGQYGIVKMAAGGNVSTPRFLSGGGDGMSDSIPATINGRQEARLADGEFVIPADVVSHLGNGSSKAGAKRLYSMMDKVRSARTGTKKQAPAVNTNRLMPA